MKKSIILWGGFGLLVIVLLFGIAFLSDKSNKTIQAGLGEQNKVTESDWIRGDINAKVFVVEYSDFECPACASYYPILKMLKERFGSEVGFVYRHFPLSQIHRNAELAAMASEASGEQGKFWEMHDLIFENQQSWAGNSRAEEIFIGFAKELELDEIKFLEDLKSSELKDKISAHYREGRSLGIAGTPTFFLNGKKISNPRNYEEFENLILAELNIGEQSQ